MRADTSSQEEYIISRERFQQAYDMSSASEIVDHPEAEHLRLQGFMSYKPRRRVLAVEVDEALLAKHFPSRMFMAPWNEPMAVEPGDFLVNGNQSTESITEIVRIERMTFFETYEPCCRHKDGEGADRTEKSESAQVAAGGSLLVPQFTHLR